MLDSFRVSRRDTTRGGTGLFVELEGWLAVGKRAHVGDVLEWDGGSRSGSRGYDIAVGVVDICLTAGYDRVDGKYWVDPWLWELLASFAAECWVKREGGIAGITAVDVSHNALDPGYFDGGARCSVVLGLVGVPLM